MFYCYVYESFKNTRSQAIAGATVIVRGEIRSREKDFCGLPSGGILGRPSAGAAQVM